MIVCHVSDAKVDPWDKLISLNSAHMSQGLLSTRTKPNHVKQYFNIHGLSGLVVVILVKGLCIKP